MDAIKIVVLILILMPLLIPSQVKAAGESSKSSWWPVQSIDTMKFSRDKAREKMNDKSFNAVIDSQVEDIALTGATHIAINTPYDDEFIPYLKRWVESARKYKLNVWFRGNFSGWEEWFGYPKISRQEHLEKTKRFIDKNPEIFANGDIFSACPECENGGPGDPRNTGDVEGFRKFLIDLKQVCVPAFAIQGKTVDSSYFSMNGDVATLIMDKDTTRALGGIVTVDHYVNTPEQLETDIKKYIEQSGGKVVLGEFGAPILDINGNMTEDEQFLWLKDAFERLSYIDGLEGVNYWANLDSSTALWNDVKKPRKAVQLIKSYYSPINISGTVKNELGEPIKNAEIKGPNSLHYYSDHLGEFNIKFPHKEDLGEWTNLTISSEGYVNSLEKYNAKDTVLNVILEKENPDLLYKIKIYLYVHLLSKFK